MTPSAIRSDKLLVLLSRDLDRHEAYIAHLQIAMASTRQQLTDAQESFIDNFRPSQRINQLTNNLERYQRLLAIAIDRRATLEARLRMVRW